MRTSEWLYSPNNGPASRDRLLRGYVANRFFAAVVVERSTGAG